MNALDIVNLEHQADTIYWRRVAVGDFMQETNLSIFVENNPTGSAGTRSLMLIAAALPIS